MAFAGAAAATYLAPYGIRLWQERVLRIRCRQNRSLVLTYDDGPSKELTPSLLNLLSAFEAKATFFLLGKNAAAHPDIVDRIVAEGHEIGCHSQEHLHPIKTWPCKITRDLEQAYLTLAPWVAENGLYRPPYGKLTLPSWLQIHRRGATIGWWTIDSGDTFIPLPAPDRATGAVQRSQGGVVLMHDCKRNPECDAFVLTTTEQLLKLAKRENLSVQRLGEVLTT